MDKFAFYLNLSSKFIGKDKEDEKAKGKLANEPKSKRQRTKEEKEEGETKRAKEKVCIL